MAGTAIDAASFTAAVVELTRELRRVGLRASPAQAVDAARALQEIEPGDRAQVQLALRATLIFSVDDYARFDAAFARWWRRQAAGEPHTEEPSAAQAAAGGAGAAAVVGRERAGTEGPGHLEEGRLPGGEGSGNPLDVLVRKDFAEYSEAEAAAAGRLVRALVPNLASRRSRRFRAATSGGVDLRATLREMRSQGGEAIALARRRRRLRRLRVVALCDVSGSMDRYSEWLLRFLHALQLRGTGVRTFVFSTRLHDVTPVLRRRRTEQVLAGLRGTVSGWSGGTTIGHCLGQFNRSHGGAVDSRTVVLVLSDGWERGDPAELARELRYLRRRSLELTWLNPLAGKAGYAPLAAGIAAALPNVDRMAPANSLAALRSSLVRRARHDP